MGFLYSKLNSLSPKTLKYLAFGAVAFWAALIIYLLYSEQYVWAIFAYGMMFVDFLGGLALADRAQAMKHKMVQSEEEEDFGLDEEKMETLPETELSFHDEEEIAEALRKSGIRTQ